LFCCKGKNSDYFGHYLDDRLRDRGSGQNLIVNAESSKEVFDAFEDIDQSIVTCPHILSRLTILNVTKSWAEITREIRTDNRISIAEKTAFAGGNALRICC
jgi:hypothetical protein